MTDRERAARQRRKDESVVVARHGRKAAKIYTRNASLETIEKIRSTRFWRLLQDTPPEQLAEAVAEYLTGSPDFSRLVPTSMRSLVRFWKSLFFVHAFVDRMRTVADEEWEALQGRDLEQEARDQESAELTRLNHGQPTIKFTRHGRAG